MGDLEKDFGGYEMIVFGCDLVGYDDVVCLGEDLGVFCCHNYVL